MPCFISKHDEKGLIIEDENQTIEALKFEGYYNIINGYSKIFKDKTTKAFYKSMHTFVENRSSAKWQGANQNP